MLKIEFEVKNEGTGKFLKISSTGSEERKWLEALWDRRINPCHCWKDADGNITIELI